MTSLAHAPFCADRALVEHVTIVENVCVARDTFRVRFRAPGIAARIVPGQFVMLRLADCDDPLLGRPLALYDTTADRAAVGGAGDAAAGERPIVDIVYLVVGKLTGRLAQLQAGAPLVVWGPLGNGFPPTEADHLLMVAGGIGQTPFLALAREYLGLACFGDPPRPPARAAKPSGAAPGPRVTLCYGARTKDYLAGVVDFERLGVEVRLSTDDGSAGHKGLVTDLVCRALDESPGAEVVCCGPERMMEAVARLCAERGTRCLVSLETPMACGIGICFSCVTKVRDGVGGWDYRRTCVEGPIFDAAQIEW